MGSPKTTTIPVSPHGHLDPSRVDDWGVLVSNHTVVVHPETTEDVAKIVKIAVKYKMPVTPYSGGTSLEGHFRAVQPNFSHLMFLWVTESLSLVAPGRWYMRRFVWDGQDSRDTR